MMARFRYRAFSPDGQLIADSLDAPSRDAAIAQLRAIERLPVSLEVDAGAAGAGWLARLRGSFAPVGREPAGAAFLRSLQVLLAAGLTPDRALEVLARAMGPEQARIAAALHARLRAGAALSEAMEHHPLVFDCFVLALVRAGEIGGTLPATLAQLLVYLERDERLRGAVRTALVYPAILVGAATVSLLVLLVFVVPQFETLFREAAVRLPLSTRVVIALSSGLRDSGWVVVLVALLGWLAWRRRSDTARFRLWRDRRLYDMVALGPIIRHLETERFARSLAALLSGGVAIQDALGLAAATVRNTAVSSRLLAVPRRVREGTRLSLALAETGALLPLAVELIRVGEEAGRLVPTLERLADNDAGEIETALKRLVILIEPALIVLVGLVVGFVVLSLLSALVSVNALVV